MDASEMIEEQAQGLGLLLDCGHPPTPGMFSRSIDKEGISRCMLCSGLHELQAFNATDSNEWFGYLDMKHGQAVIVSFPGQVICSVLTFVERSHPNNNNPFGGHHKRVYWKGRDTLGRHWYGSGPGFGMYTRMHRSKHG